MSRFVLIDLPAFSDDRGDLCVIDGHLPFPMRRVYWIRASAGTVRGQHRHRQTRQALIALQGSVTIHMDDGKHIADILLDSPTRCLLVEPEDWHAMHFGANAVLLVIASHPYDASDYVSEPYR